MRTIDGIRLTAKREIVTRTRERSFLISGLVTMLILAAIILVPKLFGSGKTPTFTVGLVGAASQQLGPALREEAPAVKVKVRLQQLDQATAESLVRRGKLSAAIVDGAQIVVKSSLDSKLGLLVQDASRAIRVSAELRSAGLDQAQIGQALAPPALPVQPLVPTGAGASAKKAIATVAVFLLYGQIIGFCFGVATGVVEEKATRVVEVILAAVRPVQLLAGKIIGIGLVGLLQLAAIGLVGLVLATAVKTITLPASAWLTIGSVLLWFLLGYAFYASLFAVAGAIVSRQEELQNTATPLNLVLVASFFLAFNVALNNSDSLLARVASYLPRSRR